MALFDDSEIASLVKRMELLPKLVRRQQEELILEQVSLPPEWLEEQRQAFLGDQSLDQVLESRGWSERDLDVTPSSPRRCVVLQSNVLVLDWRRPFFPLVAAGIKLSTPFYAFVMPAWPVNFGFASRRGNHFCGGGPSIWCWRRSTS